MIQVIECEQNSLDWHRARMGIPTASMFASILAKGEGKMRRSYMMRLAAELLTDEPLESYSNADMERGHAWEDEARNLYAFMADAEPVRVGFIRNGQKGCSPDALIGERGILEIKTKRADLMVDCLLKDEIPPEHRAQCQGALWVAEREWIDLTIYSPKLPLFVKRIARDDGYIATLAGAVNAFNDELHETVARIRAFQPKAAAA